MRSRRASSSGGAVATIHTPNAAPAASRVASTPAGAPTGATPRAARATRRARGRPLVISRAHGKTGEGGIRSARVGTGRDRSLRNSWRRRAAPKGVESSKAGVAHCGMSVPSTADSKFCRPSRSYCHEKRKGRAHQFIILRGSSNKEIGFFNISC